MTRTASPPAAVAAPPRSRGGRLDRDLLLALVPALALLVAAWQLRWVSEDGFIYLRVVENLLAGDGPVFNPGERVEAYTGPAWLALLAAGSALLPFAAAEHIAVVLGAALAAGGLAAGTLGTRRLLGAAAGREGVLALPLGALVVAALPPFCDYATAGLETPLVLAWLGGCWWGLVRSPRSLALAAAIGTGPLIRPDLAIFAAAFLLGQLVLARPGLRRGAAVVAVAAALPVAYQVFRMGYFATLVPTTALAKEPGLANWGRGLDYLANLLVPYLLPLPLAALAVLGARRRTLLAGIAVAAALVHVLYVVRLGGDYMHARMLLPSLFALLLPVAVVPVPRRRAGYALALAVVAWAGVCAAMLRASADRADLVYDQRRAQLTAPGHPHPVTLADHRVLPYSQPFIGDRLREMAPGSLVTDSRRILVTFEGRRVPVREPVALPGVRTRGGRVVAWMGSIGRAGYAAGPAVWIVDRFGLADPVAGRLRLGEERRARPGHEKQLPLPWVLARFANPATVPPDPEVAAARAALECGDLARVLEAVTAPLTAARFLDNLGVAVETRTLRIPDEPVAAARELCQAGAAVPVPVPGS
jgi:arabinofuranosyltransferase